MARPENLGSSNSEKDPKNTDPAKEKKLGRLVAGGKTPEKPAVAARAEPAPVNKRFNEAFAESFLKKPSKEDTEPTAGKAEKPEPEAPEQAPAQPGDKAENLSTEVAAAEKPDRTETEPQADETNKETPADQQDEGREPYGEMLNLRLNERQFGNEFVVNLDGEVTEHVVSLRENPAAETEPTEEQSPSVRAENPYPVYSSQLEQQQFARDEQPAGQGPEAAPPAPEAGAGGGGEVPPTEPPEQAVPTPEEPEPSHVPHTERFDSNEAEPSSYEDSHPGKSGGASVNPSERPATRRGLDDALHRSAQIHEQRGVLSGLFVGTLWANRRLKRRQKRQAKELRQQGRELDNLQERYDQVSQSQEQQRRTGERRFAAVDKRFENIQRPEKSEQVRQAELVRAEAARQELLKIPQDHRLETSAWHTIEVDNKTGKPVENPTFQYGHEYYRERSKENGPADQRTAATGGLALGAITTQTGDAAASQTAANATTPNASSQDAPKSVKEKAQVALNALTKSDGKTGPLWPWLVALAVVIVLLVSVLS